MQKITGTWRNMTNLGALLIIQGHRTVAMAHSSAFVTGKKGVTAA